MKTYPQLATRLFGVPLLIERNKLEVILGAVAPRLELEPEAYGPGDTGKSRKDFYVSAEGIAVIDIVGPLVKRASGEFLSGGPTTYGQIESEFTDAVTDPAIKGIILQIDSPGGESTGCFELANLIYSQRDSKPIFASVDGDAYSAGYGLASSAGEIWLLPSGGAGSIGVWMMHQDWSAANEKIGVKPTYIFAGSRKIDGNPDNPLSAEAKDAFQSIVDMTYGMFVDCVARNRNMTADAVKNTDAALFFGRAAVTAGLVDHVGTFSDAMQAMQSRISKSTSVAMSAAKSTPRRNMKKPNASADTTDPQPGDPCPECSGTGMVDGAECTACNGTAKVLDPDAAKMPPAKTATFAHARSVVGMCALAGLSARASLAFLRADVSVETIRAEILEAKADLSGKEINSHVMPDAGNNAGSPSQSGIVKRAEAMAAAEADARKGGK